MKEITNKAKSNQNICFDFDGVINSYKSGWQGATIISDPPVEGVKEAIDEFKKAGYNIVICSSRAKTIGGKQAIVEYLKKYHIYYDRVDSDKPPAIAYIDDRAIQFNGNVNDLVDDFNSFKPWYQKTDGDKND